MHFEDWGLIPYPQATEKQENYLSLVAGGEASEAIFFCKHPAVVTLGRATEESDLMGWQGEIFKTSRGGKATYHGPEQLVVYPILDLNKRTKDLHLHLRNLENALIETLRKHYDIYADGGREDATGVWIGTKKIASIGIAVRKWITYHGLAVNLNEDPLAFTGISPCGFQTNTMVSLEELTGSKIDYKKFQAQFQAELEEIFKV